MNILLPEKFCSYDNEGVIEAEVVKRQTDSGEQRVLNLYRPVVYKRVTYDLTRAIYGDTCMYCKERLATTIDHRISKYYRGPTITNNLYPACEKCNSLKSNMLEDEFQTYLSLPTQKERKEFVRSLVPIQRDRLYGSFDVLPPEWFDHDDVEGYVIKIYKDEPLGAKYKHQAWHLQTYKTWGEVVVSSADGVLLDGFNVVFLGKERHRTDYRDIVIDNLFVPSLTKA